MSGFREAAAKLKDMRARDWLLLALLAALALFLFSMDLPGDAVPSDLEARLERVLSHVEGAGEVRVMVRDDSDGVAGVLIVAEGASDLGVRLTLQSAVRTLLDVDNAKIEVVPMKGGKNDSSK